MRFRGRINILALLVIMIVLVGLFFMISEATYLANYRSTLMDTAATITRSGIDQLFAEINQMWYEINLISSTIARSEEVQRYVNAEALLPDVEPSIRLAANLAKIGAEKVESVIITDFLHTPLFAYGRRDMAVLEDARDMIVAQGRRIASPTHFQLDTVGGPVPYCVNFTDTPAQYPQVYVIIIYNVSSISRVMQSIDTQYGTMLALFDAKDQLFLSNNELAARDLPGKIGRFSPYDIRTEELEIRRLALMNWHLVAYLNEEILLSHMDDLVSFSWLLNVTLAITLVFFVLIIQQQINNPIRRILKFMQNRSRDPAAQLNLRIRNEIYAVAEGLNTMLGEINAMTEENLVNREKIFNIEIEQKRAENAALMSQINPHFLYNTLDGMRGIALARGQKDFAAMVSAMAYIMRYSVKGGATAAVRDEISSIERYMEIITIRHGGRIRLVQELEGEIMDCYVPKMLLQPIVENAVFHGLEPSSRPGRLTLRGFRQEEFLVFVVEDDGKGMTREELEALRESLRDSGSPEFDERGHIGLRNIQRRLRLLFGESCGIEIESERDAGTKVSIRLYPDIGGSEHS